METTSGRGVNRRRAGFAASFILVSTTGAPRATLATRTVISSALLLFLSANAPSLQLDWRGGPECPSREAFLADVRRLRGEVVESADDSAVVVVVEVTFEPSSSRWRGRVATRSRGGRGLRALEADTCADVVAAAAVVVSLALSEPETAALLEAGDPASSASEPDPKAPPLVSAERRPTFSLGVTGGVRAGPLPQPAPGASLAAAVTFSSLRLEAAFTTPFITRVVKEGAEAELAWWVSARAAGCLEFSLGRVVLAPCVLVHGGWLAGRGVGGQAGASGSGGLAVVSAGGLARTRLFSALWVRLDGSGGVALARPRFVTTTGGVTNVLAESAPWLFDVNLGLEWHFDERP